MKALKVFKNHIQELEDMAIVLEREGLHTTCKEIVSRAKELKKAIAELEAINNGSCENCIHCIDIIKSHKKCKLLEINVDEDFYCKYWEEDNERD